MRHTTALACTLTTLLALNSLTTISAFAKEEGEKKKATPEAAFKKLDSNADAKLSEEEYLASPAAQKDTEKAKAKFKSLDQDGDGFLTLEEFSAGGEKKKKKKE
jgi:Ca2+-binding EF-hand superfamily protein